MKTPFSGKLKITGWLIAGAILMGAIGFFSFYKTNPLADPSAERGIQPAETPLGMIEDKSKSREKNVSEDKDKNEEMSIEDKLVSELKLFYGKTISKKSTQLILLKVKKYLLKLYPEDGKIRFYNILKRAFPDLADEIIKTLEKMEHYQRWQEENEHALSQMNELERQGALWEKRRALFGDEAAEIWTDEVLAYEKRKQDVRETLGFLNESDDTSIQEKLDIYKTSLDEAYEGSPEAYVLQNRDMLAKVFFGIDSIQNELKNLAPDQRRWEINMIRREMGFSEQEIEKMEAFDAHRDRRWENGLAYMAERENMIQELEGPELEKQLKELRDEYFKHEAKTIALEEKDGFFRYNRPRVYGRN